MNIYKRRYINALKIAGRINRLLKKGYIIIDENDDILPPGTRFVLEGDELILKYPNGIGVLYFKNNKDYDDGYYTKIEDYNKQFENWKIVKSLSGAEVILSKGRRRGGRRDRKAIL